MASHFGGFSLSQRRIRADPICIDPQAKYQILIMVPTKFQNGFQSEVKIPIIALTTTKVDTGYLRTTVHVSCVTVTKPNSTNERTSFICATRLLVDK